MQSTLWPLSAIPQWPSLNHEEPPPTAPSTRQSYHLRTIHGGKAEPKSPGEGKKGGAPGSSLKLKTVDLYGYKERFDYEI